MERCDGHVRFAPARASGRSVDPATIDPEYANPTMPPAKVSRSVGRIVISDRAKFRPLYN
jgi:hypothetical protein